MHVPFLPDRASLRRDLRARRRALSATEQRQAARALALRLARETTLRHARRIALYWPMDGEIDPRLLALARDVFGHCPRGWWLTIPVENTELGEAFSARAQQGVQLAIEKIRALSTAKG